MSSQSKSFLAPEAKVSSVHIDDKTESEYTWTKGEIQPSGVYRDAKFAIVFLAHLVIIFISAMFAPSIVKKAFMDVAGDYYSQDANANSNNFDGDGYYNGDDNIMNNGDVESAVKKGSAIILGTIAGFIFLSALVSLGLTVVTLYYLQMHAERVIKISVIFTILWFVGLGVLTLVMDSSASDAAEYYGNDVDNTPLAILFFILGAFYVCYAYGLWKDIPFAASTLSTGVTACRTNLGVFAFAFASPLINFVTVILQFMSLVSFLGWLGMFDSSNLDEDHEISGAVRFGLTTTYILFLLSLYWTSEVIKNITTVTVSGTVGTWWYSPVEARSCCSSAVMDSFKRATSYSFGSICFGSLIVAILNVINNMLRRAQRNGRCGLLWCVIRCIMVYIERLVEYFNKWAFVYVGLYGYDYMTAGKNVMTLFKSRGWSTVIAHSLVQKAMGMIALCIALVTGLIIALASSLVQEVEMGFGAQGIGLMAFFLSFYISIINSSTLLSVVSTSTDTAIVCFAEGPAEFEENHPQLSMRMQETFAATYPDVNFGRADGEVV